MEAAPSRSQGYKGTDPSARSNARHLGSGDTVPGSHQLAEGSEANECSMVFQDVKALHSLLQCLKSGGKQVCKMKINRDGLDVHFQDASKTLQCSVHLQPELFAAFDCPYDALFEFGLQLNTLLDTLAIFAAAPSLTGLTLSYSQLRYELRLSMTDASDIDPHSLTTHATLRAVELPDEGDLQAFWEGPVSSFHTTGSYPKEAIEDLEWPQGPVELYLTQDPPRVVMSSAGTPGALQIEIPSEQIHSLEVCTSAQHSGEEEQTTELRYTYKYRSMKAAFCSPVLDKGGAQADSNTTKVQIDSSGLLKVLHLIKLQPPQDPHTQRHYTHAGEAQSAVITFVMIPDVPEDAIQD